MKKSYETNAEVEAIIANQKKVLIKEAKQMSILQMAEAVIERAKDTQFDPEFFKRHHGLLKTMGERLGMSEAQVVLLSIYMESQDSLSLTEVSDFLECSNLRLMQYSDDVDDLRNRHYIKKVITGCGNVELQINKAVMTAFKQNKPYVYEPLTGLTKEGLCEEVDNVFSDLSHEDITWQDAADQLVELFTNNLHLTLAKEMVRNFCEDKGTLLVLAYMCSALVYAGRVNMNINMAKMLFHDNVRMAKNVRNSFAKGEHPLFKIGLIEYSFSDGMAEKEEVCLTKKAKELLLCDYDLKSIIKRHESSNTLDCEKIVEKELFYNDRESEQVCELQGLLDDARFCEIQQRLKDRGMRRGFCTLFYGSPGTGKSETAMQLARMTGRNIIKVDVDNVKSKWVGESEENIRQVFKSYRDSLESSPVAPILLFNECDAILGIRKKGAEHAVDKMENSIQNILLEEMEKLDGIMICTTNLTENLDPAFERRFLYKIEFSKPEEKTKGKIWRYMLPKLQEEDAMVLARKYNFSGGQIENIARRQNVKEILHGDELTLEGLMDMCDQEGINKERRHVGFMQ